MDADEFRRAGKEMIDYVADYLENIRSRRPMSEVEPGYLRALIPDHAPEESDQWEDVFKDIERVIMPGVGHLQHPDFHAYYPTTNSYPSILAGILSDGIGCNGCTWATSPACTELEVVMVDWLGKLLNLPEEFLFCSGGNGGGVIQGSASEATLMALLSARTLQINKIKRNNPEVEDAICLSKFVAYSSDQANLCVEKAGLIACIKMRALPTDDKESLRGQTLLDAIQKDRAQGLIPMFACATLGTTASCAFDNVQELGEICKQEGIWMHIDAAYAGSAFICPEFRPLLKGVENAESFNFNPHKWLQVNFDCSAMWVKHSALISDAFAVNPIYFQRHADQGKMPDYRHWQIPLSRRFRALKLWFVLRSFGLKKLQESIRKDVRLAYEFEEMVRSDPRFELFGQVVMGLVCFKLKRNNEDNTKLSKAINTDGRIHMVPGVVKETYFLRFAVCASRTNSEDVQKAWIVIQEITEKLFPN